MSRKIERFAAPPYFEESGLAVGQGPIELQDVSSTKKEIWLIKAPANFDGKKLDGVMLDLGGDSVEFTSAADDEDDKKYEALCVASLKENEVNLPYLLVPSSNGKTFEPAPALNGQITIVESLNVPPSERLPDIEASKAPEMPEGLRQRFKPFGWEEPINRVTCVTPPHGTGHKTKGKAIQEDSETPSLAGHQGSKKKKRKHEKEGGFQDDVVEHQETLVTEEDSASIPKKKKKKKKKSLDND